MFPINWRNFRKADMARRRQMLDAADGEAREFSGPSAALLEMADALIENAFGILPVPLGLAGGFLIDGRECQLPLATEEPSVIAAASFAAAIVARHGGFITWSAAPCMTAQIFLLFPSDCGDSPRQRLAAAAGGLAGQLAGPLASMSRRGGGYRGYDLAWVDLAEPAGAGLADGDGGAAGTGDREGAGRDSGPGRQPGADDRVLRLQIHVDTRDAMGANLLNTCAEGLRPWLEATSGGRVLMAILSNAAPGRLAGASCRLPVGELGRGELRGADLARRIELAARVADSDAGRAVTHNKGIMNGISALALATGNDTRAIEAAAHAWAARDGRYRALSGWRLSGGFLEGRLELPLPFATVGGALGCNPAARLALEITGADSATELARLAAALGLAQNFAALQALTGEGIQAGHMKLHARREAWLKERPPR